MRKTSEERFRILVSKLRRHERACEPKKGQGVDHDLSNVRCFPSHIEIELKDGQTLELTGSMVSLGVNEVALDTIVEVHWIIVDGDILDKANLKKDKFDCMHLQTEQELLSVEGMGQSVFPVMSFIKWVIYYG